MIVESEMHPPSLHPWWMWKNTGERDFLFQLRWGVDEIEQAGLQGRVLFGISLFTCRGSCWLVANARPTAHRHCSYFIFDWLALNLLSCSDKVKSLARTADHVCSLSLLPMHIPESSPGHHRANMTDLDLKQSSTPGLRLFFTFCIFSPTLNVI